MTQKLLSQDDRLLALEVCEKKIFQAFRRGLDATRAIASELRKIRTQELFSAKKDSEGEYYTSWSSYVENELHRDRHTIDRIIDADATMERLEEAEIARLPENESQVLELARVKPPEMQPKIWQKVVLAAEQENTGITLDRVRHAVEMEEKRVAKNNSKHKRGLEPKLDVEDGDTLILTAQGDRDLDRIGELCGEPIRDAIRHKRIAMEEKEIHKWAEQKDKLLKNIAYYILQGGDWTVAKAIAYDTTIPDGATTLDKIVTLAAARGGSCDFQHEGYWIKVEKMKDSA